MDFRWLDNYYEACAFLDPQKFDYWQHEGIASWFQHPSPVTAFCIMDPDELFQI